MSCWVAGDCVSHTACCAMVWVGFQSVRVSSPLYRGHALKWSHVSSSAWLQMHLVYPAGTWIERLKKVPTRTGPRCAPSACNPC